MLAWFSRLTCYAAVMLAACDDASTNADPTVVAAATIRDAAGTVVGEARFVRTPAGALSLIVTVRGLTIGAHGVHVHALGSCDASTAAAFASAGGHYSPTAREHGRLNPAGWHAGDLPNLIIGGSGTGQLEAMVDEVTTDDGSNTLFDSDGSAIVIHQNEDDQRTNSGPMGPGNSGGRIACGVITRSGIASPA